MYDGVHVKNQSSMSGGQFFGNQKAGVGVVEVVVVLPRVEAL